MELTKRIGSKCLLVSGDDWKQTEIENPNLQIEIIIQYFIYIQYYVPTPTILGKGPC